MSVVVIGLNHRTAPLALLERAMVPPKHLAKALHDLCSRPSIGEAVVLSTCNRTEVYAVTERFHGAFADISNFFTELGGIDAEELDAHLYSAYDTEAVAHLFSVAAGLDSAVLGESEILGQVRTAWERARAEGAAHASSNMLFRRAVEVGKRARTETGIGRSTTSVSHAAVDMATERLGGLEGRRVLVMGAGDMGEGMAVALAGAGVGDMVVANRTVARAQALAERVGGRAVGLSQGVRLLGAVDLLLTSTGAGVPVIDHATVEAAMKARPQRPLLIVDIAVPRDVDSMVASIDGVTLLDLDDLRDWAARGRAERESEVGAVRQLVEDEVLRFTDDVQARQVAPLVAQLHDRAEEVRQQELTRFRARLADLDDREREAVEALTRGLIGKLLHEPSVRLKADAGSARGERNAAALRDLFDLG